MQRVIDDAVGLAKEKASSYAMILLEGLKGEIVVYDSDVLGIMNIQILSQTGYIKCSHEVKGGDKFTSGWAYNLTEKGKPVANEIKEGVDKLTSKVVVPEMELTGELDALTRYVKSLEKKETPDEDRSRI
jgi:hypothetical protein